MFPSYKSPHQRTAHTPREVQPDTDLTEQGGLSAEWEALKNAPTIEGQANMLNDGRIPAVQRQALAAGLGRIAGNQHMQRVAAQMNAEPSSTMIQREGEGEAVVGEETASEVHNHDHEEGEGGAPHVHAPQTEGGTGGNKYLETDAALKVLQDSFGTYKTMSKGTVKILGQADFQAEYDKIYGTTQYSWARYVVPRFGNLGGFAHDNINYINTNVATSTTVPHEMLHNNAHSTWSGFVGSNIDEGTTEHLTFVALTAAKYTGMTSKYPNQYGVIKDLVAVIGDEVLKKAYFNGENEELRRAFNQKCKGAWVDFKKKMDEAKWTEAKELAVAN